MINDIKYEIGTRLEIIRLMLLATMEEICRQDFDNITQLNLNIILIYQINDLLENLSAFLKDY